MEPITDARHLADLYAQCAERYGELPAFATRRSGGHWTPLSFRQLYTCGSEIAAGLAALGVEPGDRVGVISDNRVEWMMAEVGIQCCAAVNTPRGTDVTDEEWHYIFRHADVAVAFVESERELRRLQRLRSEWPQLREVILLDPDTTAPDGAHTLSTLRQLGRAHIESHPDLLAERAATLQPDDLFTLIYTSGTTGQPKGVMLTHANMMSQMRTIPLELTCTDRVLSILPIWHIFERMFEVYTMSRGVCTYYTSLRTLGTDLQQVEPTFMGSAPRLWESLHHRIMHGIQHAHPMRRLLFHTAYALSRLYRNSLAVLRDETLAPPPHHPLLRGLRKAWHGARWFILLPWYGFFNAAVLETVRLKAGGCLKATISGGGALPRAIDDFFNYIGIQVLEGYGLTETCPVLAVRVAGKRVPGTVGPVIPDTECRIVDMESGAILYPAANGQTKTAPNLRGEIHVRGPQVMNGYFKEPELTATVLSEDGWFRTGDIGSVSWNGCLRILGRCKATIVLSNGENVEPEPIESRLRQWPHIDHVALIGQDCKHLYALVAPDLKQFQDEGHAAKSLRELAEDPQVESLILQEVRAAHHRAAETGEQPPIRAIRLVPEPFEAGRELTNLFKLKRHVIAEKYADLVKELMALEHPPPHAPKRTRKRKQR